MRILLVLLLFRSQLITSGQDYSDYGTPGKTVLPLEPDKNSIAISPPTVAEKSDSLIDLNDDPCVPNPCQNGGICRKDLEARKGAFHCACPLVYRGKFCHLDMLRCETLGCKDIIDCVASPAGGVCVCTGDDPGRLCQMDIGTSTQWDQIKMVISERTMDEAVVALICICVLMVVTGVSIGVHCHRVNSRRTAARARYKDALKKGYVPEPPPDWCDISNDLIRQTFCCKKDVAIDKYLSKKSLSKLKIQQQEEALKELLSQTNLPAELDMMNEVDEQGYLPYAPPIDPEMLENRTAHARSRSFEDARRAASLLDARIRYSQNRYPRGNINTIVRNALASQQRRNVSKVSNSHPTHEQQHYKSNHKSQSDESNEDSESVEESKTTQTTDTESSEVSENESVIPSKLIDSEIKKRRMSVRPIPTEQHVTSKEVHANRSSHAKMRNYSQSMEDSRRIPLMMDNRTVTKEQPLPARLNARYRDNEFQQRKEYNLSFNANLRPRRQNRNNKHMTQTNERDFENLTSKKKRFDVREATGKIIAKNFQASKTNKKSLSNKTSFSKRLNDYKASTFPGHRRTMSDERILMEASDSMQNGAPEWDYQVVSGDHNFRYRNINTNTNIDENDDSTAYTPRYHDFTESYETQKPNQLHSSYKYPSYNIANHCNICDSLNTPDYGYLLDPPPEWDNFDKGDWYSNGNPQISSKIKDCVADEDVVLETSEYEPKHKQVNQVHPPITHGNTCLDKELLFNYKHENVSDLMDPCSELNNCDPDEGLQTLADTEAKGKMTGSEFYGIFSTTVTIPVSGTKSEDNSQNRSGFEDASKHPKLYCYDKEYNLESHVEKTRPPEEDLSSDRMYLRSFEKDGQKLYYVGSDQFEKNANSAQFDGMILETTEQIRIENNGGLQQGIPILPCNVQHSLNDEVVAPIMHIGPAESSGITEHDETVVERKVV